MHRDYYYDINGKKIADEESMAAFLLDEDVLFLLMREGSLCLFININDYFVPAADGELLTSHEDLAKLFDLYAEKGYSGVAQFVAEKRGIPNVYWRENPKFVGKSNA